MTYSPVWGTLQAAGGVPNPPNDNYPSPVEYMNDGCAQSPAPGPNIGVSPSCAVCGACGRFRTEPHARRCIHASKEGWHILMSKLYKDFFAARMA